MKTSKFTEEQITFTLKQVELDAEKYRDLLRHGGHTTRVLRVLCDKEIEWEVAIR